MALPASRSAGGIAKRETLPNPVRRRQQASCCSVKRQDARNARSGLSENFRTWRSWRPGVSPNRMALLLRPDQPPDHLVVLDGKTHSWHVAPMRIPSATYRLQLNRQFTFADAAELIPYLDRLGVSDCYLSPVSRARPGSDHGYDVIDHELLNPELGGAERFEDLAAALARHQLGVLLDVVPNHMCIAGDWNWRWLDVLENGPSSPAARFFDIDWRPPKPELLGKVLLPVLGEQYGRVLEEGTCGLLRRGRLLRDLLRDQASRSTPRTWPHMLEPALADLRNRFGDEEPRRPRAREHHPRHRPSAPAHRDRAGPRSRTATRAGDHPPAAGRADRRQRRGQAVHRPGASRRSTAAGETRAASTGWRRCWPSRPTG